jgi:hypothetical protein
MHHSKTRGSGNVGLVPERGSARHWLRPWPLLVVMTAALPGGSARADVPTADQAAAPHGAAEPSIQRMRLWHRRLELVTLGSLVVTGTLGGLIAVNRTSSIHTGRCDTGDPLFGAYGCGSLSTIHGVSAVSSLVLYASTTTFELAIPGVPAPEKIARHETSYRALTYFHRGAIVAQPVLGILARFPDVIGIDSAGGQLTFSKVTRTVHEGLGIAIVAAYAATVALSW